MSSNIDELYESFEDFKMLFVNSTSYLYDLNETRNKDLADIKDILDHMSNDKQQSAGSAGASVKDLFSTINDLFKDEFKKMLDSFNGFFNDVSDFDSAPSIEFTKFLENLMNAITLNGKYEDLDSLANLYKRSGDGIKSLGESITPMSKGLLLFSLVSKTKAPDKFIGFLDDLINGPLSEIDGKKIDEISGGLSKLGVGIFDYSKYMALSAPLLIVAAPASYIAKPVISNMLRSLMIVNGKGEDIEHAATALKELGKGMILMSASMGVMAIMPLPDISNVAMTVGVMGTTLGLMTLLSKVGGADGKYMKSAATSMAIMGGALGIMALTFPLFEDISSDALLKAGATLTTMTLLTKFLASSKSSILFAPVAMGLMSGAVYLMALSMKSFHDVEWEDMGKAGAAVAGMSLIIGLISQPEFLIGAGIVAGVSLSLAYSVKLVSDAFGRMTNSLDKFKKIGWDEEDNELIGNTFQTLIGSIITPMTSGGVIGTIQNIYGGIAGSMTVGVLSLVMDDIINSVIKFRDAKITKNDASELGDSVSAIIDAVKDSVTEIGKSEGFFTDSDFENGIEAISGLGSAIGNIADGVYKMSTMTFKDIDGNIIHLNSSHYEAAGNNIASIVNAMKDPITEIGGGVSKGNHKLFGMDLTLFADTDFENGLEAISSLGTVLNRLADGIIKMATNTFTDPISGEKRTLNSKDYKDAGDNISLIVDTIKTSLTEIGSTEGLIMDNDFKNGLDSFDGFKTFVDELVGAVSIMASGSYKDPVDGQNKKLGKDEYSKAGNNIKAVIGVIKTVFTDIGSLEHWYTDGTFIHGKEALMGVGPIMTQLAASVNFIINELDFAVNKDGDNTKMVTFMNLVKYPVTSINEIEDIDDKIDKYDLFIDTTSGSLSKMGDTINTILGYSDSVDLNDYITRVSLYNSMTYNLLKLADKSSDVVTFTKGIGDMNNSTIELFKTMNDGTIDNIQYTIKLFDSLSKLNEIEFNLFDDKIKRVEDLITKTNEINSNVSSLNAIMSEENKKPDVEKMVETLMSSNEEIISALNEITTVLRGRLLVEIDE